ncbi:MAG: YqgE/AlgH family protein [Pseudomonadota bacterium]
MPSVLPSGFLRGQFVIAMPALADPNFFQTVTCISEHSDQGALGIVINRVHALLSAKDIFSELDLEMRIDASKIPVHIGGPVHGDEIFVLHGPPMGFDGCLPVSDHLALSNSLDILEALAKGQGPEMALIALGCAGWAPGQLDAEMRQNAWLNGPATNDIIFRVPIHERWECAIRSIGIDPALLTDIAGHA